MLTVVRVPSPEYCLDLELSCHVRAGVLDVEGNLFPSQNKRRGQ